MNLHFQVKTLENGLKCIYVPMNTPGSACSNIVYNIGSANERAGEYGLAHLLEHGMHFGSPKYNANTEGGLITDMELKAGLENATTFYRTNHSPSGTTYPMCLRGEAVMGSIPKFLRSD